MTWEGDRLPRLRSYKGLLRFLLRITPTKFSWTWQGNEDPTPSDGTNLNRYFQIYDSQKATSRARIQYLRVELQSESFCTPHPPSTRARRSIRPPESTPPTPDPIANLIGNETRTLPILAIPWRRRRSASGFLLKATGSTFSTVHSGWAKGSGQVCTGANLAPHVRCRWLLPMGKILFLTSLTSTDVGRMLGCCDA